MIRALLLLFMAVPAWAAVGLKFEAAPVVDVLRVIYSDIRKEPVIVTSAALDDISRVTLDLPASSTDELDERARQIAAGAGLVVTRRAGVVIIDKRPPDEKAAREAFVYRPRYRPPAYLVELLGPLFGPAAFSHQRGIENKEIKPAPGEGEESALAKFDRDVDVLVFNGTPAELATFQRVVEQIDAPTPEILVKAVVFEVTTDGEEKSAMSLAANILGGRLGINLGSASRGDFSAIIKTTSFTAIFDALTTDRRFKVVTAPTLRVRSGASARLTVGSETPVIGGTTHDRNGNPVQNVQYRPAGVILDLRPQIREHEIELDISQQISNFVQTTTGVNNSPTLIKREVNTRIGLRSADVVVLGGLDQQQDTSERRGLPFLPEFLQAKSSSSDKTEVMLLIQAERITPPSL